MAGIEATTQQIGPINPANLIGLAAPVVEPRATAALSDAFRQGVITADEITTRFGEVGKSADAAKVMQAKEAVSPEQQAARAAQTQQATVAAQQQTRRAQYPGTAAYDLLAPGAGIEAPLLPDGSPDVAKENQIGTHLAAWDSTRKAAAEEEKRLVQHVDKATNTVMWLEPGGGPVPPARLAQLRKDAHMPFQDYIQKFPGIASSIFPGAGQVAEVAPTVAPIEVTPESRAGLARKFGADSIATMSDSDISQLFQSEQSTPPVVEALPAAVAVAKPEVRFAGQPVAGGYALGPAPVTEAPPIKSTAEQDKAKLAMTRFAESNDMLADLEKQGYNPANFSSSTARLLPEFAMTEEGKLFNAAKSSWVQGILRLESGAAIAKQEQKWYETSFFPIVGDTAKVQEVKTNLRHGVEQMVSEIARLGGETPETKAVADRLFQQAKAVGESHGLKAKGETTGGTVNGVVELPDGGQAKRNAQGNYIRIK